jgi:RNA polymerase sigma-70 factor (ECF subfamily)
MRQPEDTKTERTERTGIRRIPYPEATDEQLVLAALLGDLPAFDELIRRYRNAVILAAQPIVGSRAAAEDVAQEVFLLAFKALPQLDEPSRFGWWLRAIARRRAGRHAEKERRTEPAEMTRLDALLCANMTALHQTDPARAVANKAETDTVWKAVETLSEEHREVLILRGQEGWSIEQIAAFLDLSDTAVRGRLFRARAALKNALQEQETKPTTTTQEKVYERKRRRRQASRSASSTPPARTDLPHGGTLQYDRSAGERRAGCGGKV